MRVGDIDNADPAGRGRQVGNGRRCGRGRCGRRVHSVVGRTADRVVGNHAVEVGGGIGQTGVEVFQHVGAVGGNSNKTQGVRTALDDESFFTEHVVIGHADDTHAGGFSHNIRYRRRSFGGRSVGAEEFNGQIGVQVGPVGEVHEAGSVIVAPGCSPGDAQFSRAVKLENFVGERILGLGAVYSLIDMVC